MAVPTVTKGAPFATFINVLTVQPETQRALVDALAQGTEEVMRHYDGFISADIHAGSDGTKAVDYAQRDSQECVQAATGDLLAQERRGAVLKLAEAYGAADVHRPVCAPPMTRTPGRPRNAVITGQWTGRVYAQRLDTNDATVVTADVQPAHEMIALMTGLGPDGIRSLASLAPHERTSVEKPWDRPDCSIASRRCRPYTGRRYRKDPVGAASFPASGDAALRTGQTIVVDGGPVRH
ncbi:MULTISPECIES: antibiotic biosynthesis monooxygenase [Streptomyces]|uniref:antibiotic biosynthesis monooxygenase n=1 Tax=Streptomyces lycopersici TaxID=2974589 RepID=UPI0021CEBE64|nr:antibiotic biosynthesis monooxygenase [Streptomyces sp. NEAU-383]